MTALHKFTVPARRNAFSVPPAQPIDIEELLGWTYRIQQADMVRMHRSHDDYVIQALSAGSGRGALPCAPHLFVVHADAMVVHGAVERVLEPPHRLLVIEHARKGERPDWCQGVVPMPRMRVAVDHRGSPRWNHAERRPQEAIVWIDRDGKPIPKKGGGKHDYGYCLVDYIPSEEFIEASRGIYRAWRAALYEVCSELQDVGLQRWKATGPRAPVAPWEQGS